MGEPLLHPRHLGGLAGPVQPFEHHKSAGFHVPFSPCDLQNYGQRQLYISIRMQWQGRKGPRPPENHLAALLIFQTSWIFLVWNPWL
jgi:hypothetical protein